MTDLIVLASASDVDAARIRDTLFELKQEQLIQLVDAVSAIRKLDGKIKVQHEVRLIEKDIAGHPTQGMLLNFVLWLSWQEITAGVTTNIVHHLRDYVGVDDKFVEEVNKLMESSHLALFLLAAGFSEDKVRGQLQDLKLTFLKRSLSQRDEAILKETFGA